MRRQLVDTPLLAAQLLNRPVAVRTIIAATALERGLTVVTADEDFRRVPGLSVTVIPRSQLRRRPSGT